jgi:hypothetical protein
MPGDKQNVTVTIIRRSDAAPHAVIVASITETWSPPLNEERIHGIELPNSAPLGACVECGMPAATSTADGGAGL